MKRNFSIVLLVVVVALMAVSALLVSGEDAKPVMDHGKKAVVVINGSEPIKINIDDLKDGESRTIKEGDKEIVVTRKGDSFEVQCEGKDGEQKHLTLGSDEHGDGKVYAIRLHKEGDKDHKVLIHKTVDVKGEGGEGTICVTGGEVDGAGSETYRIVTSDDTSGEKHLVVTSTGIGKSDMHWCGSGDSLVFRCKDDDTMVTVQKDKLKADAMNCPVCGKAMDKLDGPGVKVIKVLTTVKDEKEK